MMRVKMKATIIYRRPRMCNMVGRDRRRIFDSDRTEEIIELRYFYDSNVGSCTAVGAIGTASCLVSGASKIISSRRRRTRALKL